MDKRVAYAGSIPLDLDLLRTNLFAEIGIAKVAQAVIGNGPAIQGLACTQNSPTGLTVLVGPGEVYTMASLLPAAYSSIPQDTTHQVLKQGILLDAVTLGCPAPGTAGQSINYLIQVAMSESDADLAVLQYWNAANPSQPYSGPGNAGTAQAQTRKCGVVLQVKAGTSATTGSQTTPTPDAGYIGAWVVTVANGQSSILNANISRYPGAPFIGAMGGPNQTFSAYLSANQTGVVTATWTKIAFNQEEWDTYSVFDAVTNRRFQPTAPGKYMITAAAELSGSVAGGLRLGIYKNGSLYKLGGFGHQSANTIGASVGGMVDLNGSSDYVEIFAFQDSGSNQAIVGSSTSTWVQGARVAA